MYKQSDAPEQSDFLINCLFEAKNAGIRLNSKLMRDMLDVIEGTRRGHLTRTGSYSHRAFKLKCRWRSREALTRFSSNEEMLKNTVRDHALPMIKFIEWLYHLETPNIDRLIFYIDQELISVVITKEENDRLTKMGLSAEFPEDYNGDHFSRYKAAGIEIVDTLYLKKAIA